MRENRADLQSFFLNELHELLPRETGGGGRSTRYVGVDWAAKSRTLSSSLSETRTALVNSSDPLRAFRNYLLAKPAQGLRKQSSARNAVDNTLEEPVSFQREDSHVFRRLGIDLLGVTRSGDALVHVTPDQAERIERSAERLVDASHREQNRWAKISSFELIPLANRVDEQWLSTLPQAQPTEMLIEFQPLLARTEVETLLQSIRGFFRPSLREALTRMGQDFSGRFWVYGRLDRDTIRSIASQYFTVQSVHPPLTAALSSPGVGRRRGEQSFSGVPTARTPDISTLPTVAIVDCGIPSDHVVLKPYMRGQYVQPGTVGHFMGDHGSSVSSRAVFNEVDLSNGTPTSIFPRARFYDVNVCKEQGHVDSKLVLQALQSVVATAPDVRVFTLCFDSGPLGSLDSVLQAENLNLVQDLDNFIFHTDVFVVVSSGNTRQGVQPTTPYPNHVDDGQWELGSWARSYNSVTCSSSVGHLHSDGLAPLNWPSPFARVGPGIAASPKPDFCAPGGNTNAALTYSPGMGVPVLSSQGYWEDQCGTSFAAPVLAAEAARAIQFLQQYCPPGTTPFAALVRSFLTLTAVQAPGVPDALSRRALGYGVGSAERLFSPRPNSAVFMWQGVLEHAAQQAQITLRIPQDWINAAGAPTLRIVACWMPPVNAAVRDLWSCRKLSVHLRPGLEAEALRARGRAHISYTVVDKTYSLKAAAEIPDELWLIDVSYSELAEYYAAQEFSPQQKVAFTAELFDSDGANHDIQQVYQRLPISASMNVLSSSAVIVKTPVLVRV